MRWIGICWFPTIAPLYYNLLLIFYEASCTRIDLRYRISYSFHLWMLSPALSGGKTIASISICLGRSPKQTIAPTGSKSSIYHDPRILNLSSTQLVDSYTSKLIGTKTILAYSKSKARNTLGVISKPGSQRRLSNRMSQLQRLGCDYYNISGEALLSQHRKPLHTKLTTSKERERLTFATVDNPGPTQYLCGQEMNQTSEFHCPTAHKISVTKRSSLIDARQLPGPGFYDWDKYFLKQKETRKPIIQYKFVYGHAN